MSPKNPAAVALGRRGGKARAENQTLEQRIESARRAAQARWARNEKRIDKALKELNEGTKALLEKAARKKRARQKSK